MSFLDILNSSADETAVISHVFLLKYNSSDKIVHAFFEGATDESFYGTFIRRLKPQDWKLQSYNCKGKDSVHYFFEQLSSKHHEYQPLLFFVDKDIDDVIPFERQADYRIYVTDYYSIENYVVTRESIEQIWSEIFRQPSGSEAADQIVHKFDNALEEVHQILIDVMSWVLLQRRNGGRPNLDCIQTQDYFNISDELEVTRTLNLEETLNLLDAQTKTITPQDKKMMFNEYKTELLNYDSKTVIRGHNEMDFFITFIQKLKSIVVEHTDIKTRAHLNITTSNIVDVMGPRVQIPESLRMFLNEHLQFEAQLL